MGQKLELLPCPFCGGSVQTIRMDSEGNLNPDKYFDEEGAWSGVSYGISHPYAENTECAISTDEEEYIGCHIYDSLEELAKWWNKRVFLTKKQLK